MRVYEFTFFSEYWGHRGSWLYGNLIYNYLSQSVPIIAKVVGSNPAHGEVYSMQHYVIKLVSDLRQVGGFLLGTLVSSTNKTDRNNITKILLKVALAGKILKSSPLII